MTKETATAKGWKVETPTQTGRTRFLICVSGGPDRPFLPPVQRGASGSMEFHSGLLKETSQLTGRDVVVISGGSASAYDLLNLFFEQRARRVRWVHRALRWMVPTRKSKHLAGGIRELAPQQMSGAGTDPCRDNRSPSATRRRSRQT